MIFYQYSAAEWLVKIVAVLAVCVIGLIAFAMAFEQHIALAVIFGLIIVGIVCGKQKAVKEIRSI